jgi:hypothetical protein
MRETTQRRTVMCRMAARPSSFHHRDRRDGPMELLRASAVALSFVALAVLVEVLSLIVAAQ